MIDIARSIRRWFMEKNIPTESVTIIVNIADAAVAAETIYMLGRELAPLHFNHTLSKMDLSDFQLHGIKFKIESPLQEPEAS